jgi:hypothetical protein
MNIQPKNGKLYIDIETEPSKIRYIKTSKKKRKILKPRNMSSVYDLGYLKTLGWF